MNGEHVKLVGLLAKRKSQQDFGRCKAEAQQFAICHCCQRVEQRRTERIASSLREHSDGDENHRKLFQHFLLFYSFGRSLVWSSDVGGLLTRRHAAVYNVVGCLVCEYFECMHIEYHISILAWECLENTHKIR